MRIFLLLLFCFITLTEAWSQEVNKITFKSRTDVPVFVNSKALANPWSGGLNTPQFSTIDLNKDGTPDLFVFDRQLKKVFTWLAVQESGEWRYSYAPEYEVLFPADLEHWVLLRDYNCDGLKDIFTSTALGIRVFKQEVSEANTLTFTLAEEALFYNSNRVNMQMNKADVPAISDIDGDGDLDVLIAEFSRGLTLELYQNKQVEDKLSCGTFKFEQKTNWWGRITECEGCNKYLFGAFCRVAAPLHTGHDGSSLLLLDMDADGDKELISGAVQCDELVHMENEGSADNALMTSFTTTFPETKPASFPKYPAAYYEDVTFDGVPDLLVAPQATYEVIDIDFQNSNWFYKNLGTAVKPDFNFVQDDFLQSQMIDLSEGAYPAFADIDGDGDLDMLVSNLADMTNGTYSASLRLYLNNGTSTTPSFVLTDADYLQLKSKGLFAIKPSFADMNGDGAHDLVLSYREGNVYNTKVMLVPNKGALAGSFKLSFSDAVQIHQLPNGASPTFVDINSDFKPDMLVGMANGSLAYYKNIGTPTSPEFILENNSFGGIGINLGQRAIYPSIGEINGNKKPDLLTVDDSGVLLIYQDFLEQQEELVAEIGLVENRLVKSNLASRFGKGLSLAVAPLGGENSQYVVVGSLGGGMYLLEQVSGNNPEKEEDAKLGLEVYPNPVIKAGEGKVFVTSSKPVHINVFDAVGRVVISAKGAYKTNQVVIVNDLSAGVYFIRAYTEDGQEAASKLIIQ